MRLAAAGISDCGNNRADNQDAFLVDAENRLFVVADGIGGHRGGAVAAKATVTGLQLLLTKAQKPGTGRTMRGLQDIIRQLNASVYAEGTRSGALRGMGSTLVCLLVGRRVAYVANMGDSRVYLLHHDRFTCLTKDHSLAALLVREGEISAREAVSHPGRGHLTRYIGMEQNVCPDICKVRLAVGDRFLLCSDGLWNVLPDKQMAKLLAEDAQPDVLCANLIAAAKANGSQDNITCVVVKGMHP